MPAAELRASQHLRDFLCLDIHAFTVAKAREKDDSSRRASADGGDGTVASSLMGWFGKAKQMVKESDAFQQAAQHAGVDISALQHERVTTPEDAEFASLWPSRRRSAPSSPASRRARPVPRLGRQLAAYHRLRLSVASTLKRT